jgi:hypothetical protein
MINLEVEIEARTFAGKVSGNHLSGAGDGMLVQVEFSTGFPYLQIGRVVQTVFKNPNYNSAYRANGRIMSQTLGEGRIDCEFLFGPDDLTRVDAMLNQRGSLRVRPSMAMPVTAHLNADIDAAVHDISSGGVALLVSEHDQNSLLGWEIRFRLDVPDCPPGIEMAGIVRQRKLVGSMVFYGVSFDEKKTVGFVRKQEFIQAYVMRRQHELLRERAAR